MSLIILRSNDFVKSQTPPSPLKGEGWGEGEKRGETGLLRVHQGVVLGRIF